MIGEKLITVADAARDHPPFAKELPRVLATIWQVFNEYEIAGYVASRKPLARKRLRQLLYLRSRHRRGAIRDPATGRASTAALSSGEPLVDGR